MNQFNQSKKSPEGQPRLKNGEFVRYKAGAPYYQWATATFCGVTSDGTKAILNTNGPKKEEIPVEQVWSIDSIRLKLEDGGYEELISQGIPGCELDFFRGSKPKEPATLTPEQVAALKVPDVEIPDYPHITTFSSIQEARIHIAAKIACRCQGGGSYVGEEGLRNTWHPKRKQLSVGAPIRQGNKACTYFVTPRGNIVGIDVGAGELKIKANAKLALGHYQLLARMVEEVTL